MVKVKFVFLFFPVLLIFYSSCRNADLRRYDPEGKANQVIWSAEDLLKEIAIKEIYRTKAFSGHKVRLQGKEKPHIHKDHDLAVFMVKGQARVFVKDHWVELYQGDKIKIGRGVLHWAENTQAGASEAYAVFSPPLEGPDMVLMPLPVEES